MPADATIVLRKGDTLGQLDSATQGKTVAQMTGIIDELRNGPAKASLLTVANSYAGQISENNRNHVHTHWLDDAKGYWPGQDAASKLRDGLVDALELAKNNATGSTVLPLDSYWLVYGTQFVVESTVIPGEKVAMIIITPPPKT